MQVLPLRRLGCGDLRQKHVPMRTCVICRDKKPKRDLLRVVRTPEGRLCVDPSGRAAGRGAYLCADGAHWGEENVRVRSRLGHALSVDIAGDQWDALVKDATGAHRPGDTTTERSYETRA